MFQPIDWSLVPSALAAFVFSYLIGSIPFGVILTRLAGAPDVRSIGSGNIGATNVLRTGRKGLAAATLLGDAFKGTAAVLIVSRVDPVILPLVGAFGAFIGHLFPVWLKFRGGKGVATYIGVLLALSALTALAFCLIWLAVAALSRYSSLAALVASAATPLILLLLDQAPQAAIFALLAVLLWIRHHENITRLINGTESRIGKKSNAAGV